MKEKIAFTDKFEVENLGEKEQYVYDIEVEHDHNFFANNICVHNSCYVEFNSFVKNIDRDLSKNQIVDLLDKVSEKVLYPYICESYQELADYMNATENAMEMEREIIADKAFWKAKKRYAANVLDCEGDRYDEPQLKIMGLESVSSKYPDKITSEMQATYRLIVQTESHETRDKVLEQLDKVKSKAYDLIPEDIAFTMGVNGLEKYTCPENIYRKGTPIHVRASLLFNRFVKEHNLENKYHLIKNGDKVKFCYLKMPNPIHENVIAFSSSFPREFIDPKYLDYKTQYEKCYENSITELLSAIGISTEDTLEDFFQ